MPIVNSRSSLKEYCLRMLGSPVMQINVDDDQVEDRIDDALAMFHEYHADGLVKEFKAIKLSATALEKRRIPVPSNVYSVIKMFPATASTNPGNLGFVAAMSDFMGISGSGHGGGSGGGLGGGDYGGGLFRYFLMEQNLQLMNQFFSREKMIRFNKYQGYVEIDTDWDTLTVDDYIILECWSAIDMDAFENTWGNPWLEYYATALIKKQWGMNMIKYDGVQLPSGITLNGRQIYDDAVAEIAALEDELRNTWQLPCDFFMG